MTYGDFPTNGINDPSKFKFPAGAILNKDLSKIYDVDLREDSEVQEYIERSWYQYEGIDKKSGLHPWKGQTTLNYTGPKPPFDHLNVEEAYSFLKTPRWKGNAMEVGPLARVLVGYGRGIPEYKEVVDSTLAKLNVPVEALFSTLGRTAARGLETMLVMQWTQGFYDELITNIRNGDTRMANMEKFNPDTWPAQSQGVGFAEAPRGALAHWININNQKIENYQLVVPTTWNASPRDPQGGLSAYESALMGTPVADENQPVEILRTIHSFDPCMACAVHLYDEEGTTVSRVQVVG
jgi:hydrogenase large subunit